MSRYKAVLFDFDGTLIDTNELILNSWRHLYKVLAGRICEDSEVTGSFGEDLYDSVAERFRDVDTAEAVAIYRQFQMEINEKDIVPFPGAKECLDHLVASGLRLAIVTSRRWSTTSNKHMKFGLDDRFETKVTADDTDVHKPDPTPILLCLKKLDLTADDAIYVGDSRYDVQCAHNAGMKCALVDWSICHPREKRVGIDAPDWTLYRYEDLYDILGI